MISFAIFTLCAVELLSLFVNNYVARKTAEKFQKMSDERNELKAIIKKKNEEIESINKICEIINKLKEKDK